MKLRYRKKYILRTVFPGTDPEKQAYIRKGAHRSQCCHVTASTVFCVDRSGWCCPYDIEFSFFSPVLISPFYIFTGFLDANI